MIQRPTVFVLGAGASMPYGLPSGKDLAGAVIAALQRPQALEYECARAAGYMPPEIESFCARFQDSACDSLDSFVEAQPRFRRLAAAGMVAHLLPLEAREKLTGDWLHYVLNKILSADPNEIRHCQLRIITFNFDRSVEERIYREVLVRYDIEEAAAAQLAGSIPVLHIHGQLGALPWSPHDCGDIPRLAYGQRPTVREVLQCASNIRIAHEEIPPHVKATAVNHLKWAEAVGFLGFGYHRSNLDKLDLRSWSFGRPSLGVYGTAVGLTNAEVGPVTGLFGVRAELHPSMPALGLLRNTQLLQI